MISEQDIKNRIGEIEAAISDLEAEKRALTNLMYMQINKIKTKDITNPRSYKRIYNEEKIKQILRHEKTRLTSKNIFLKLNKNGVTIKEATVRSYLSRMHKKGEIDYNASYGSYELKSNLDVS